jgi:hypothetical protein
MAAPDTTTWLETPMVMGHTPTGCIRRNRSTRWMVSETLRIRKMRNERSNHKLSVPIGYWHRAHCHC